MRPIRATRRKLRPVRDPAPSKWVYRYQRLMLTPGFRGAVRIGVPLALIAIIAGTWVSNPANRAAVDARVAEAMAAVQTRPEFMLTGLVIAGADEGLTAKVAAVLPVTFPASSFEVDFVELRQNVVALPEVSDAHVKAGDSGALQVSVTPRVPVALWRDGEVLHLLDADGVFSGQITMRADRLDLPLVGGQGAYAQIDEALMLFARAQLIAPRVRGLVRMGERRWDLVLNRGQRVQLPADNPAAAVDRVIVLNQAQDLLERDVAVVDMRNPDRPTVRMSNEAAAALRRVAETREDE